MNDWLAWLEHCRADNARGVLVSVVSSRGSVPREPGARMLVAEDGVQGTIGGGHLELQAVDIARDMLARAAVTGCELKRFPLGASLGQCCGGLVNLLFEPIGLDADWIDSLASLRRSRHAVVVATTANGSSRGKLLVTSDHIEGSLGKASVDRDIAVTARKMLSAGMVAQLVRVPAVDPREDDLVFLETLSDPDFRIVLFGAGHVGRAVAAILAEIPCRLTWIDSRENEFPPQTPANASIVVTDEPEEEVSAAPPLAYFLVMTHSHALDQALAERILERGDFAYFGLIGSIAKRRQFERRMAQRGIPVARFAAMTCPIGVPGISGKDPATIAIAVAAQLLQVRERTMAQSRSGSAVAQI